MLLTAIVDLLRWIVHLACKLSHSILFNNSSYPINLFLWFRTKSESLSIFKCFCGIFFLMSHSSPISWWAVLRWHLTNSGKYNMLFHKFMIVLYVQWVTTSCLKYFLYGNLWFNKRIDYQRCILYTIVCNWCLLFMTYFKNGKGPNDFGNRKFW